MRLPPGRRLGAFVTLAGAAALLTACELTTGVAEEPEDLSRLVAAMGFRGDMVEDHGDFVLVEGDIRLETSQLYAALLPSSGPDRHTFQYRTNALVGSPKVQQIRVNLSGLNNQTGWQTAAREALAHWNGLQNSYVRMVEGTPADISVGTACVDPDIAAFGSWPSGGNPGSTVTVNTCFGFTLDHAQRVRNMVHEFGHTLGFRHTNYAQRGESAGPEGAVHVPGTPTSGNDAGSVMNGGTALSSWAGFSVHDRSASAYLYPLPRPTPLVQPSGSTPQVLWSALVGTTGYTVHLRREEEVRNELNQVISSTIEVYPLGTTTQTSIMDWNRTVTGVTTCHFPGTTTSTTYLFDYEVQAAFPNGNKFGYVAAPVANCSQLGEEEQ